MAKQVMLTAEGLKQLEEELDLLKGEKRKEIAEKIKVARSYGDLSENSEYEATLKNAVVIDEEGISNEHIHVGSKVKLLNLRTDSEVTYKIVGSNEANPSEGKISDESPVGLALLGHAIGDAVEVEVPAGVIGFKVLDIFK